MTEPPIAASAPIVCFGEILWDSVPGGLFPGGAPMNVAYHLKRLGLKPIPVTAVGRDRLGEELLRRLDQWGLPREFVGVVEGKETGVVLVELSKTGGASYEIVQDVAWDWIEVSDELLGRVAGSEAVVYGTLAQREERNRKQLRRILEAASGAMRVYDVNMRPPYDAPELILELCKLATLVKLNDEELHRLLEHRFAGGPLEEASRALVERVGCPNVCVTAGARGAGLLREGRWHWVDARSIEVRDTIGAGDSFLAALLHGLLTDPENPKACVYRACRLAEFVASQSGATPLYSVSDEGEILTE